MNLAGPFIANMFPEESVLLLVYETLDNQSLKLGPSFHVQCTKGVVIFQVAYKKGRNKFFIIFLFNSVCFVYIPSL